MAELLKEALPVTEALAEAERLCMSEAVVLLLCVGEAVKEPEVLGLPEEPADMDATEAVGLLL